VSSQPPLGIKALIFIDQINATQFESFDFFGLFQRDFSLDPGKSFPFFYRIYQAINLCFRQVQY